MVTRRRITHLPGNPHRLIKNQIDIVRQWAAKLDLIDGEDEILTMPLGVFGSQRGGSSGSLGAGVGVRNLGSGRGRTPSGL